VYLLETDANDKTQSASGIGCVLERGPVGINAPYKIDRDNT